MMKKYFVSHPFNALLKQTRDMSFLQGMHELPRCVMWRHEFNTVDKSIKFLYFECAKRQTKMSFQFTFPLTFLTSS